MRERQTSCRLPIFQVGFFSAAQPQQRRQWCRSEMWSGHSDLSAVSMASLLHHLNAGYYTLNSQRESERVGEIYLFILKEWRGGFMSYQPGCIFSAWWIMVRYLLILWKEEWRQPVTSFLSVVTQDSPLLSQPCSQTPQMWMRFDKERCLSSIWYRNTQVNLWHLEMLHTCLLAWFDEWLNSRGESA